ncbi:MAG: cyanophycin synthetase, partial [Acidobacteriota bacterium]
TEFQGVVQRSGEKPVVVIDGGHNPAAALALGRYLGRHTPSQRHLVFSMLRDKEIARVLAILQPLCERIFLTQIDSPRAAALEDLIRLCPLGIPVPNPRDAHAAAFAGAETVVVAGSFFLAGAILAERG